MKRGKREAKRTGLGRRLLSVFLAVVMCTSMLQLTVFAEGTDVPSNVMDGAFVLDTNGNIVSNEGAATVTKDGFTLTKTADGKYTISVGGVEGDAIYLDADKLR